MADFFFLFCFDGFQIVKFTIKKKKKKDVVLIYMVTVGKQLVQIYMLCPQYMVYKIL